MALDSLQTCLFLYACVSITVYSLLVYTVVVERRKRNAIFQGSFFSLFLYHYVADILMFVEFNLLMRARKYGYLNSFFVDPDSPCMTIVPRFSTAVHYHLKIIDYFGQAVFAANRLSAALMPLDYNKIWSQRAMWCILVVQYTLPLAAVLPVNLNMAYVIQFVPYPEQNTLRLVNDPESTEVIAYIDLACSLTGTVLSLAMYAATMVIIRRSVYSAEATKQRISSAEIRLLLSALLVFMVLTFNTVIQILKLLDSADSNVVLFLDDIAYPMVDLIYTCQPWALLLSSSVLRSQFLRTFRLVSPDVSTAPFTSVSNSRKLTVSTS